MPKARDAVHPMTKLLTTATWDEDKQQWTAPDGTVCREDDLLTEPSASQRIGGIVVAAVIVLCIAYILFS